MRKTTLKSMKYGLMTLAVGLVFLQATAIAQENSGLDRTVEGVWLVTITPRNCTTGDPIPTAAFKSLWTFHEGGIMSASFQPNGPTLFRTLAHGLWKRENGWSDYSFKVVHIRTNTTTFAFAGKQETAGTLVLGESGNEFTTDGGTTVFSVDDIPGTSTCSNSVGTRFKLD